MGIPLYVTCCFSLAAFNIFSLNLIFVCLINMCLGVLLLGFILYGTLQFLDLVGYFLSHVREVLTTISLNIFSGPLSLFFSWDPYNSNAGTFNIVPGSLRLSSFLFIFFLCSAPQQLFPPFSLPAHLFVFLPQLFCY